MRFQNTLIAGKILKRDFGRIIDRNYGRIFWRSPGRIVDGFLEGTFKAFLGESLKIYCTIFILQYLQEFQKRFFLEAFGRICEDISGKTPGEILESIACSISEIILRDCYRNFQEIYAGIIGKKIWWKRWQNLWRNRQGNSWKNIWGCA